MATIATLTPSKTRGRGSHTAPPWNVDLITGKVLDQHLWNGDPVQLIGFTSDYGTREVEVIRPEFSEDPALAEGMHPIFVGENGRLWTSKYRIGSVAVADYPAPIPAGAHASTQD